MPKFYPEPPRNPALVPIKERIATVGGWSERALFPSAKAHRRTSRRVFVISRFEVDQHDARQMNHRRFAVVAADFVQADNRITALLK